jgi:rRNA processing protein Krr1/Pno1
VFFSSFIIKIPPQRDGALKKEREKVLKKEEGKKLKEFLQIKWRSQYFDRRKTF